ncbi:hypothetical protein Q4E93_21840 [Flavitalea sp. BT771]|uniref:hypothetical protein n=1 Tax=Flavitalea sp. BT771 TaxID=3063329 RepID=UPI0026E22B41|nr:hypothetical protein [Flavitalea sp. BT771]MDO6433268.1 hypothetical protein [Flavitalea sp. BT771]MDV6222827.1 hypothetical protein [Flavitalea sp. BT771]
MKHFGNKISTCLLPLLLWLSGFSQTIPATLDFKSPEVAAFNRHIETPVSTYTGVPSISVPLYEMNIKGVKVPITLDYHAGGIRVDQEATIVGLGWSLNFGGEISRAVRGAPDDKAYFGATGTNSVEGFNSSPSSSNNDKNIRSQAVYDAKQALTIDFMPDMFYYSVLGYSGRFMFSQQQNKFILFPKEDINVQQTSNPVNSYGIGRAFYSWNLQLPDGTSVDFGKDAVTSQIPSGGTVNTKSSWQIKTIRNIYNDSITYTYESYSYNAYKLNGESVELLGGSTTAKGVTQTGYSDTRIKSIRFPGGTVNFTYTSRQDMPTLALAQMVVLDNNNKVIKTVKFDYSYFTGDQYDILATVNPVVVSYVPTYYRYLRLRLDSISMVADSIAPLKHKFDYYTNVLMPSKFTFAQDHFGFYNGKANMAEFGLIPDLYPFSQQQILGFPGGDRRVNPQVSNVFSLKSITYPEGGRTELVYESNSASLVDIPFHLVDLYQDDNLRDTAVNIFVSGWSRHSFYPSPDSTAPDGTQYFIKQFTISSNGHPAVGLGWNVSTNFGTSSLENNTPYNVDNVYCKLEQIDPMGNITLVQDFSTTPLGSPTPYQRVTGSATNLNLSPGNYRLTARFVYLNPVGSAADNQPYNFQLSVKWRELDTAKNMVNVGGLRIKKINSYTQDNVLARVKKYTYTTPTGYTSGKLASFPQYVQKVTNNVIAGLRYFSNSVLPLETTSGSYCGYQYVDEYDVSTSDSTNVLRTNYEYSFVRPTFVQYFSYMQSAAYAPSEWTRGKLVSRKVYKGNAILSKEDYDYYSISPHLLGSNQEDYVAEINTDFISYQSLFLTSDGSAPRPPDDFYDSVVIVAIRFGAAGAVSFYYGPYNIPQGTVPYLRHYTGFDKPITKKNTLYDDFGNSIVTTDSFYYDKTPGIYQLTRTRTTDSKASLRQSSFLYPYDFNSIAPYSTMGQRHILNPIIQKIDSVKGAFVRSSKTNYQDWGNNIIAPSNSQSQVLNNPAETRAQYMAMDSKGNPLTFSKSSDEPISYVWDYNQLYPVAEVKNGSQEDIAYSSFEFDGAGNWSIPSTLRDTVYAITGRKSYNLSNGAITRASLTSLKTYFVSYWTRNAQAYAISGTVNGYPITGKTVNGWTLYIHKISGQTTIIISGTGNIDELRLYPQGAQMTTYAYDPLVGMTSQCDISSRLTYYEYDGLQRLLRIRDMDGNIVKQYEYQYQASTRCGTNCYILSMTNLAGTGTLSYPVGVFNANGKLLDTASNQARFITRWNADTANANRGTLSAGGDSMHFQLTLNAGKALPAITGCRFHKVDLSWNQIDGVRNINGCYVDFGDGASVRLPPNPGDIINPLPANTIQKGSSALYLVHTYADTSLKTLTFYHNDAEETQYLDNVNASATSLSKLKNFRGNLPQHMKQFGSSSYQQASMSTVANVSNWTSIHSINDFHLNTGDGGTTTIQNLSYQQDFMAGNPDLQSIQLARNNLACYFDSTFKISRLKSDWNTWFKHLQFLSLTDAQWNREDLSGLKELNYLYIIPGRPHYSNDPTGNAEIPIPQPVVDGIFNQVASGSGQSVNGGFLYISSGGSGRSSSSDTAVSTLLAKGWTLYLDGQQLH